MIVIFLPVGYHTGAFCKPIALPFTLQIHSTITCCKSIRGVAVISSTRNCTKGKHLIMKENIVQQTTCFHCGEDCTQTVIEANNKAFCCAGCKMVYEILNQNGLCDYYEISKNPGASRRMPLRKEKFQFLDDEKIRQSLVSFTSDTQTNVTFYLPQIHCSSCLWLLENLHRLNEHIISSQVNFTTKEADIVFNHR